MSPPASRDSQEPSRRSSNGGLCPAFTKWRASVRESAKARKPVTNFPISTLRTRKSFRCPQSATGSPAARSADWLMSEARHEECGGHALPRHVGDHEEYAAVAEIQVIEIVAADLAGRIVVA